jgi:ATP-dependent helicase HepA
MNENYKRIIHGIQALRRRVELQQCPVLGGAGVRAFCYPHQLYVVQQVLKHTRIRHLLADEVGLGKTLESLMIMNALRLRNGGKLRVSIVVGTPERAKQWTNEIRGRFHFPFWKNDVLRNDCNLFCNNNVFLKNNYNDEFFKDFQGQSEEFYQDGFHLVNAQNYNENRKYLEPEHGELFILDEIHNFSDALLKFLASRATDYQNVLVLSATPLMGEEKDRWQLLKILNPEQAELCELKGACPTLDSIPILRSRRRDFPKALPQRITNIRKCEPLESDILRYKKSRNLMQRLVNENLVATENAVLFLRRAAVGGQTLIDRVDEYRRKFTQYASEFTYIRELCSPEQGDARFDELMDYLFQFFAKYGERKIIIAAQDNPTIDYLAKEIKRCLPEVVGAKGNKPLKILQLRQERKQAVENNENEEELVSKTDNKGIIDEFWQGKSQILLAHNDARESYNLQIADALVFYSLPWDPNHMEQWLGRISRLGLRKRKTVEVVTIVLRETIGEQIAELYESLNMFEEPLDLEKDKNRLKDITQDINNTALNGGNFVKQKKCENEIEIGSTQIVPKDEAEILDKCVRNLVQPIIYSQKQRINSIFPQEDALCEWIDMLKEHQIIWSGTYSDENYEHSKNPEYYKFSVINKLRHNQNPIPCLNEIPIIGKPFILKRVHIQIPPRDLVPIIKGRDENRQRYEVPLQFFNFGGQLHDELVETFIKLLPHKLLVLTIDIEEEEIIERGKYLVGIVTTERQRKNPNDIIAKLTQLSVSSIPKTQQEMRRSEFRRLKIGLQADDRFLDILFPGTLEILTFMLINEHAREIKKEKIYPLLTRILKIDSLHEQDISPKHIQRFTEYAKENTLEQWRSNCHVSDKMIEERIIVLENEMRVYEELIQIKIENVTQKITELQTKPSGENERNIRMNYEPDLRRLQEQLQLVHKHFEIRKEYLSQNIDVLCNVRCSIVFEAN